MNRLVGAGFVTVTLLMMLLISAHGQTSKAVNNPSHMANSPNSKWVYRHDPANNLMNADKNSRNGSLCTVLSLSDTAGDGTVGGTLTFYRSFNYGTNRYAEPHRYTLPPIHVTNAGNPSRVHEKVTWAGATPLTSGDMPIDVHVSLMKGKENKGKGDPHARLVVRFKYPARLKGEYDDCCDQEPDDDVLQEETPPPADPPAP